MTHRIHFAALAAAVSLACMTPAMADLVFRISNQSAGPAKGIVQNQQVLWLKPGQTEDIRIKGNWGKEIKPEYVVNFEKLDTSAVQYCIWKLKISGPWTKQGEGDWQHPEFTRKYSKLEPNIEKRDPAFQCDVSGQFEGKYPMPGDPKNFKTGDNGEGATLQFVLKDAPKK
ncbi:MAG TPA: hypothetical protein VGI57_07610 [Usitatibacter sp.]